MENREILCGFIPATKNLTSSFLDHFLNLEGCSINSGLTVQLLLEYPNMNQRDEVNSLFSNRLWNFEERDYVT